MPNILETDTNDVPRFSVNQSNRPSGIEVFDSSNFETFKEPVLPSTEDKSSPQENIFQIALKKSQTEQNVLRNSFSPHPSNEVKVEGMASFEKQPANTTQPFIDINEFSPDNFIEPVSITTNIHRPSDLRTRILSVNEPSIPNITKPGALTPVIKNVNGTENQERSRSISNPKRVAFNGFDEKHLFAPDTDRSPDKEKLSDLKFNQAINQLSNSKAKLDEAPLQLTHSMADGNNGNFKSNGKDDISKLNLRIQILENEKRVADGNLRETKLRLEEAETALEQYANQVVREGEGELIDAKKTISKLQSQIIKLNSQIAELQKKQNQSSPDPRQKQQEAIQYNQTIDSLKETITRLQNESLGFKSIISNLQQKLSVVESENSNLKSQIHRLEKFPVKEPSADKVLVDKKYLDSLMQKNSDLENKLLAKPTNDMSNDLKRQLNDALNELEKSQRMFIKLEGEKNAVDEKLSHMSKNYFDTLRRIETLERQNILGSPVDDKAKKMALLESERNELSRNVGELKNTVFVLEREIESLKRVHSAQLKDLKAFEESVARLQNQRAQDMRSVDEMKDRIVELEAQAQSNLKKAENFKSLLNNTLNLNERLNKAKSEIEIERDDLRTRINDMERGVDFGAQISTTNNVPTKSQARVRFNL